MANQDPLYTSTVVSRYEVHTPIRSSRMRLGLPGDGGRCTRFARGLARTAPPLLTLAQGRTPRSSDPHRPAAGIFHPPAATGSGGTA